MAKEAKKFSKKVTFTQPFEGTLQLGAGKSYHFKIRNRQIWPQGKRGPKTPVEYEIDNEVVYEWLKKFEGVNA